MPHLVFLEILVSGNVKNLTPQLRKFHTSAHIIRLVEKVINTSWYGRYPIVYKLFDTIPGGCLGFLNHQRRMAGGYPTNQTPAESQLRFESRDRPGGPGVAESARLRLAVGTKGRCATQRWWFVFGDMGVSNNSGTPKSSILIGFSIINHPFRCTPIFGNTHIKKQHSRKGLNFRLIHVDSFLVSIIG